MAREAIPDPEVASFRMWVVYPYFLVGSATDGGERARILERIRSLHELRESAWSTVTPEEFGAANLCRWFYHEVRSMFLSDPAGDGSESHARFHWLVPTESCEHPIYRDFSNWRVGLLIDDAGLDLLPKGIAVSIRVLVSNVGVMLTIVELDARRARGLRLSQAMQAMHIAAHADSSNEALVLVPPKVFGGASKRRHDTLTTRAVATTDPPVEAARSAPANPVGRLGCQRIALSPEELSQCLSLWTEDRSERRSSKAPAPGYSLPRAARDEVVRLVGAGHAQLAAHGRMPLVSNVMLPWNEGDAGIAGGLTAEMGDRIEALLARCNRHPSMSDMVPLCLHELQQAEEFQTVPITGSQRLHVTCEGLTAFGYAVTPFDFQWPQRVGQEYLLTFLLALHQSVVCQELSWRSYSHRDGVRDNEALVKSYLEYVTQYESALASPQFNIQRLYRCSRTALGVERISHEVREELAAWMENEQRREQGTLNSMALGAVLAGVATLFVGLPLSYFNNDSNVALFWGSGSEAPGLLWFWTPLALLAGMALARSSIRKHLGRVWTLVWGDSAARKRPRLRGRPTRSQEPT